MKINKNEELVTDEEISETYNRSQTKWYKIFITKTKEEEEKDTIHYIRYSYLKWYCKILVIITLPVQYLIDFWPVIKEDTIDAITDMNNVDKIHFYRDKD